MMSIVFVFSVVYHVFDRIISCCYRRRRNACESQRELVPSSFVLQLDGESLGQFLPKEEHVGPDELVNWAEAGGILLVALVGARKAPSFLLSPQVSEELFQCWMVCLWSRKRLATLEKPLEKVGQRLKFFRLTPDVTKQLPSAGQIFDPEQTEIAFESRQKRPVVLFEIVIGRCWVVVNFVVDRDLLLLERFAATPVPVIVRRFEMGQRGQKKAHWHPDDQYCRKEKKKKENISIWLMQEIQIEIGCCRVVLNIVEHTSRSRIVNNARWRMTNIQRQHVKVEIDRTPFTLNMQSAGNAVNVCNTNAQSRATS